MPSKPALSGVCAITAPPCAWTSRSPREPSLPVPDSTMATARERASWASERKKWSIG
jgi:hypothetical protein